MSYLGSFSSLASQMRDDLHKSAPVGRKWQRWLRSCLRDADRGSVADCDCKRAIAADWCAEISPPFLSALASIANDPQQELLDGKLSRVRSPQELGGTGNVLEHQLLSAACAADAGAKGGLNFESLVGAVADVITNRLAARARAVHGHVMAAQGPDKAECLQEIRRSAGAISPRDVARNLLARQSFTEGPHSRGVSVDEVIPFPP
jgi:hypothetical protein